MERQPETTIGRTSGDYMDTSKKSIMTIILDLNGLLLSRCIQPSPHHHSISNDPNRFIVLRPGCIQFLETLLERFNVGIWSTAKEENIIPIIGMLEKDSKKKFQFCIIWSQHSCYVHKEKKIFRPDKPGVEAMFKPLAKLAMCHNCDPRRTILVDDSPYKGCCTPANNCVFPSPFDIENQEDNILLEELLPYLMWLDEADDVRCAIESHRYGQPPVLSGHEYFTMLGCVIDEHKVLNKDWKIYNTGRLPLAKQLKDLSLFNIKGGTSTKKNKTGTFSDVRSVEILDILIEEGPYISSMKPIHLIDLARRLGCKTQNLKVQTARAYINRLLNQYGLLDRGK